MKYIGALFCVAAFVIYGFAYLENEKKKMRSYSALAEAFVIMKNELYAKLPPLPELIRRSAGDSEGCVQQFFRKVLGGFSKIGEKDFSAIWNEAAGESFPFFTAEQLGRLCRLGRLLGQSACETQEEALENTAALFLREAEKMKEKMPGTGKLALGLSACAGLLTVIVLC